MRLKLTAAGWIPDRESEKGSLTVCEGREEYRKNVRMNYHSKTSNKQSKRRERFSVPAVEIIL